ncbi:MAG TPA: hypothetical protein VK778_16830 [Solirubrobacteraceae bacterium]|nr:hypothetical protein [Solirubrobacteraceae bacterium]
MAVVVLMLAGLDSPSGAGGYRGTAELYAARKRQEVAQVKHEIRRDAAVTRRELREELGSLARRERKA